MGNLNYSSIDGVLFNKDKTQLITCPILKSGTYVVPSTVTSIWGYSFEGCSELSSITIPSSVTSIGNSAFRDCSGLTSIYIPSSVTSIGVSAFANCTGLISIYAYNPIPVDLSSSVYVFSVFNKTTCILHVPAGSKSLYQAAVEWQDFANIVEDLPNAVNNANITKFKVTTQNGQAVITGVSIGETITIYTLQGIAIYNQQANSETVKVNLPARGVYVVRVGGVSVKVVY